MSTPPWERYQPEPELPYVPPKPQNPPVNKENLPDRRPVDFDFGAVLKDAFAQALRESGPRLKEQAIDYVRETVSAQMSGQTVDHEHPAITATTSRGKSLVIADARSRSLRTFIQGLCIDIFFAIIAVLATFTQFDPFDKAAWVTLGILVSKTLIQTLFSYIMRLRVQPTIRARGEKMAVVPFVVGIEEKNV